MLYSCGHKKALRFQNKAEEFLKAYTTNTPDQPHNAFVDIHGKIVATADQYLISSEEAVIVIEAHFEERLRRHLEKYLFLYGTEIQETTFRVYFDLNLSHLPDSGEIMIPQKAGQLILSPKKLAAQVSEEEFRFFRVCNQIPVQGIDYDDDVLLNIADEDYISYDKGCYLGQEIIARIHFRGKPARRLVVKSENECDGDERTRMTSKVKDPQKGEVFGFIFVKNGP